MLAGSSMERMSQIGVQIWRAFMTCLVYSVYGETLSSIASSLKPVCPAGFPNCGFVPPCFFERCPSLPSATCRTVLCDCTPRWFIGDVEVTHVCSKSQCDFISEHNY